ncbi:MAG: cytochrome ubiquinol oxidase subunit I, partial [Calditrichia bacterium]
PWIVYGLMRTREGLSEAVAANQVWFSLILFTLIYLLLFVLFLFLLDQKIKHGPEEPEKAATYSHIKPEVEGFSSHRKPRS